MVEPDSPDLSIMAQCKLPSISRSGYYNLPVPENSATLALMAVIDVTSSIWWPLWNGRRAKCWPGASRTRWTPGSVSRHWRMP